MISILTNIFEFISNLPQYILYAAETLINLFFTAIQALWEVVAKLLPMPAVPGPPEFIGNINWYYPLGTVLSIMAPIVVSFISWLAIKWIYTKVGNT